LDISNIKSFSFFIDIFYCSSQFLLYNRLQTLMSTRISRSRSRNSSASTSNAGSSSTTRKQEEAPRTEDEATTSNSKSTKNVTANRTSTRRSLRSQALEIATDTTHHPQPPQTKEAEKDEVPKEQQQQPPESKDDDCKDDDFMKSEHFPKLCSRVGSKYQAVIPPFNVESARAAVPPPPEELPVCVWSPTCRLVLPGASLPETSEACSRKEDMLLPRYLAQSRLILSQLYQRQLHGRDCPGNRNILRCAKKRDAAGAEREEDEQSDTDSDFDGNFFEEGSSEEYNSEEGQPVSRRRRRPRAAAVRTTSRSRGGSLRERGVAATSNQRAKRPEPENDDANGTEAMVDGSFYMISSCIEDFLLELLHKSEYNPAKALHFLALITAPLCSTEDGGATTVQSSSPGNSVADDACTGNGSRKKRNGASYDDGSVDGGSSSKRSKTSSPDDESRGVSTTKSSSEDGVLPETVRVVEDTLQWVRDVVDSAFCLLSKDEQVVLGQAHAKHSYNLNKIIKCMSSDKRRVAINYAFRFLFVASDLMQVELPSEETHVSVGAGAGNGGEVSPGSQHSSSSSSSPRSSTVTAAGGSASGGSSEMVTRASIRIERKQKIKAENDIYYFPPPNDKGRYPVETTSLSRDKRTARKINTETAATERNAFAFLRRLRGVFDNLSFRQFMNSFVLFAEGSLSHIDMAVRLRYIFETFLDMNFPLRQLCTIEGDPLSIKEKEVLVNGDGSNEEDTNGDLWDAPCEKISSEGDKAESLGQTSGDLKGERGGKSVTPDSYISNAKKLHNDFLVNFFPYHVAYWREMK